MNSTLNWSVYTTQHCICSNYIVCVCVQLTEAEQCWDHERALLLKRIAVADSRITELLQVLVTMVSHITTWYHHYCGTIIHLDNIIS